MRVGLDARTLTAGARSGVEQYVANLVRALSRLEEGPEIIAYVDRPIADPELARAAVSGRLRTRVIRARRGWLRAALPWRLWRDSIELAHFPSTILPPLLPCPAVVTVHDLAWARYPETYSRADLYMQTHAVPRSVQRAAHVIAVSQSTARDLVQILRVPEEKITAIPLGVSSHFTPDGPSLPADAFPGADRLEAGYVLYAGPLQPRKNLIRLLKAYREAVGRAYPCPPVPPLVLAGRRSPHAEEVAETAERLGVAEAVIFAGYVREGLLPALYRGAALFVYPSLYEGFGLPVLEAMASGTPVITSDRSGMAEVAGDAALLVDPENAQQLASALVQLLGDTDLREKMAKRGLARSRAFSWEKTARETAALYQRIARLR